jgi:signal transduction histidine kinase
LEVAQIESAQINLDLQPVELKAFVAGVTERASAAFPERRFDLRFPQDDVQFKLDLDRMDQVLTNLIDNAAKYSPEGKNIEVILNVDPTGVEIAVRDYGPGIAPEELNHLFEPYKRGDAERTKSTTGLGLGLFIVRGIVEAHGGKVAVESKLGEGSVFRLRFPASLRDQVAAA